MTPTPLLPSVDIPDVLLGPSARLAGQAGVGKTTLLRALVAQQKGTVLAATTGIASVNLGEGTTINALCKFFDTASLRDAYVSGYLNMTLGRLWRSGVRRIALDEISMMDAEQLTILTQALDELAGKGYGLDAQLDQEMEDASATTGEQPGIALLLSGDMGQLPPVKAPFVFESPMWDRYAAHTHRLTKVWRQSDAAFLQALSAARAADVATVCDFFGPRLSASIDPSFDGTTLFATNDAVDRYNALRLQSLSTPLVRYTPRRWGQPRGDWKNIPDVLGLKEGALVMVLANAYYPPEHDGALPKLRYANGDLGHVESLNGTSVHVRLVRTGEVEEIDWVERDHTIPLEPGRSKALKLGGEEWRVDRQKRAEVIGTVHYLPLRLAWGSTVHKAQGLTLDRVQVNTREGFFKHPGLLYVSLSRARTAEGLRLVGTVDGLRARCTVDGRVVPWL